jgi:type I restriction enzyme S subunit
VNAHWPVQRLGEIFEIARGGSPRPIEKFITDDPSGLNWIKIGDATASGKFIKSTKEKIKPEGLSKSRFVNVGDFLLTNSMSFGRPYIMATEGCIHDGWLVLKPRNRKVVDQDYMYHLLSSDPIYRKFAGRASGSTVKNLNAEIVSSIEIKLPPLKEQRRIAAIMDKADSLRHQRKRALDLVDSLTPSIFFEMFGSKIKSSPVSIKPKIANLPAGWEWRQLTDVARLATGHTPDRKRPSYWNGDVPWLSLSDIRALDGKVALSTRECVTEEGIENSSSVLLPKGTVCFSRTASVGFVAVMGRPMGTSQDFVNWVCGSALNSIYLMWALIVARKELLSLASGSTHRTIYFPTVEQFHVLIPPLVLQERFAKLARQILDRRSKLDASPLNALFTSLQSHAFSGQL